MICQKLNKATVDAYLDYLKIAMQEEPAEMMTDVFDEEGIRHRIEDPFYQKTTSILAIENAPGIIAEKRKIYKGVSTNVDFYSGMVYKMLNLPYELFTPIFAVARIVGWSAHRIEEIQNAGKIIRPAYINVKKKTEYTPLSKR